MPALNVKEASFQSAQALISALSEFGPELTGNDDETYAVAIRLANERQIMAVLHALQAHVHERQVATRVELDGRTYVVHPG